MPSEYEINNIDLRNEIFTTSRELESNKNDSPKLADFETAISATGFGKFNVILILIAIPSGWSSIFETTLMSFVFPAAQCDLNLNLSNKGSLNAITYAGMISSAFIWGFLCDTLGRKKLLITGYILDAFFVIMSAMSQNFTVLMVTKFFGGFIINGPFAALTTYMAEFHCAKHRGRIQMILGIIFSSGNAVLPLLAWAILPLDLNFSFFNMYFHSWNVYMLVCCLPATLSIIGFLFLPESPKFLMTVGRTEEAIKVFQMVYTKNTGNPPSFYPIKELIDETKLYNKTESKHGGQVTANRTKVQALKEGWQQITPLFFPPHLYKLILVCLMQMLFMMSLNSLRLWLPQIFQVINDYQFYNNGTTASLCTMLEIFKPSNQTNECFVNLNNSFVYINSMIVAVVTICGYVMAGILINKLGKKQLFNFLAIVSGLCAMSIYFAQNNATTITLSAIYTSLASVGINVVLAVVVDLFPTTLRTMTVALTMMTGRCGAMTGNFVFPLLLSAGCAPPFFSVGFILIGCAFLSCLLPDTDLKPLE